MDHSRQKLQFRLSRLLLAIAAIAFALTIARALYRSYEPTRKMARLLDGDRDTKITRFVFENQQRRIICDNITVCRYLETAMRDARVPRSQPGMMYDVEFTFGDGVRYRAESEVFSNGLSLSFPVANPPEDGWPTHSVYFRDGSAPATVAWMWDFLLAPHKEVSGQVLVIPEDANPYIFTDETLYDATNP